MIREPKPKYVGINRIWPIFSWKGCIACEKEFRREWGWRVITGPYFNGVGQNKYVCGRCAKTREDAYKLLHPTYAIYPLNPPTSGSAARKRKED